MGLNPRIVEGTSGGGGVSRMFAAGLMYQPRWEEGWQWEADLGSQAENEPTSDEDE